MDALSGCDVCFLYTPEFLMATLNVSVLVSAIVKAPEVSISCQDSVTPPICRPLQFAFLVGASFSYLISTCS